MLRSWKAALVVAALAACAWADDEAAAADDEAAPAQSALNHEQIQSMHGKIDSNKDGKISMSEIMEYSDSMHKRIAAKDIKAVLERMDLDKDGKLSLLELLRDMDQWGEGGARDKRDAALRRDLETEKFKVADADEDGLIDESELPSLFYPETNDGVLELIAKAFLLENDADKDGFLSLQEFWKGSRDDGDEPSSSHEEKEDFVALDKDGNGKLDLQELKVWESGRFHTEAAMRKLLEVADKDSDMHVTVEELSAAREQISGSDAQYHLMQWAEHGEL
mmetsp:Transcript_12526/g.25477  ORF Transcript_12526/g.25477 Transcript_12526/m.25477 type:complete len:278 (+) Transcript_12526:113-946(+)